MARDYRNAAQLTAAGFTPADPARLPGDLADLRVDAGGERWHLAGKPLHAGEGVELLISDARTWCPTCEAEGSDCRDCGGAGEWIRLAWVRVRFEYQNQGDGTGCALLYLSLPGLNSTTRHAVELHKGDGARLRWPVGGAR
jgi:hypothetical protein